MKTKRIVLVIVLMISFQSSIFSQLKVFNTGYVGINGAIPDGYPLSIKSVYGQTLMLDPSALSVGCIIGSTTDQIHFFYNNTTGYHKVWAQSYSIGSDSLIKKNIKSLPLGALQKVKNLRPISFEYKNETNEVASSKQIKIGLIAQEVEKIVPEAVSFSKVAHIKMLDYDMLIPVLIKAIQEQESIIEKMQNEIDKLKSNSSSSKNSSKPVDEVNNESSDLATLEQNSPNPFSQATVIKYYLPESSQSASIYIYDMNGLQIKNVTISLKGKGSISINGSELQPGIYHYAFIADGKLVDTKRMILTR